MSLEAKMEALAAAVEKNTDAVLQLLAGREDALAQLKAAATPAAGATRSRAKKTDDAPAGGASDAAATTEAAPATTTTTTTTPQRPVDATNDELKARVAGWLGTDPAEIEERKPKLAALLAHFGSLAVAGEKSTISDEQRYLATFYVERFKANLPVDFSAEYDFDADPLTQDEPAAAAPAASDDDMLG